MRKRTLTALLILLSAMTLLAQNNQPSEANKQLYERLYSMAAKGQLDSLKHIFDTESVDLKKYNNKNFTPVVYGAVWSNNKEVVEYLISKGADPTAKDESNETPLHRAAWNGNLELTKLLIAHRADPNIIYNANGGLSPLACAAESGNIEVVKYLIEHGADPAFSNADSGASPLRSAAYTNHFDIFKLLADKQPADYNWQAALAYAAIGSSLDIAKYLVEEKGAKVNSKNNPWGDYIIALAAADKYGDNNKQSVELVKYLISKGAKIESITSGSLFDWLMEKSTDQMIDYFIGLGVKVEIPETENGWTPLAAALDNSSFAIAGALTKQTKDYTFRGKPLIVFFADGMYNSPEVVDFLIKEGINKEHYNEALESSVAHNDSVSAALLLDAGADVNYKGADTTSLLLRTLNYKVLKLLVDRGINLQDKQMLDNAWSNPMLLKVLQEKGILPDLSQKGMEKALVRAAKEGDEWTVDYLLSRGVDVNYKHTFPKLKHIYNDEDLTYTTIEVPDDEVENKDVEDEAYENNTYNNLSSDQQREDYEIDRANKKLDINGQTALIKNAIYGYQGCNYGNYGEKDNIIQISPAIAHKLLKAGADPNIRDLNGRTALHYTALPQWCRMGMWPIPIGRRQDRENGAHGDPATPPEQRHDSIALALIAYKADLNAQDVDGNTPLILAAMSDNNSMLKILLKAGADMHLKNKYGKAFYDYITSQEAFDTSIKAGLDPSLFKKRLNKAFVKYFQDYRSYNNKYDAQELKQLLALGANPNTPMWVGSPDWNALRYTLDRIYSNQGKMEIAQVLVDAGIDMNVENNWQTESMLIALIKENQLGDPYDEDSGYYVLDFLVKNNIDLNYKTTRGWTALAVARIDGKDEVAELLEKYGAKRDLAAEWWYLLTEKHWQDTTLDDLRQLIKEGIDVNMRSQEAVSYYVPMVDQKGVTALMLAAAYGKANIMTELLKQGADVNIKAADGKTTALAIAKDRQDKEIIDLLTKAGAKE